MNAIFITVRTGSERLPDKCFKIVGNNFTINKVIDRARQSKKADVIVLCTTYNPRDIGLWVVATVEKIKFYLGSEKDKLGRWRGAAEKFGIDFFVTFDGDDLLCCPELADLAFTQHERTGADFIQAPNVPCGAFTSGIKTSALNKVCEIKGTDDTEMYVPYFTETGLFQVEQLQDVPEILQRPEIRMTLDYPEDLAFFDNLYTHFDSDVSLKEVIEYLDAHPEVVEINRHCQELYLTNQKKSTGVILNESLNSRI